MVAFEDNLKPLPVWLPEGTRGDLTRLNNILVQLGLEGSTKLVRAVPGSPGVILAVGSPPNFICSYALVSSTESPGLIYAMKCILTYAQDERIIDEIDMLREIFGPELEEVYE